MSNGFGAISTGGQYNYQSTNIKLTNRKRRFIISTWKSQQNKKTNSKARHRMLKNKKYKLQFVN